MVDLATGAVVVEHASSRALIPASNMKLLTAMAACEFMGPDTTFSTRLVASGEIIDGELRGNLVLVGNGDPRFGMPDANADVASFADAVFRAGIRRVRGDLVLVEQRVDREYYHPDWAARYAAADRTAREVAALGHGENVVSIVVKAGARVGAPGRISVGDSGGHVTVVNKTKTVPRGRSGPGSTRDWDSNRVTVRGSVPLGKKITGAAAVHDPPARLARLFRNALAARGVQLTGGVQRTEHVGAPAGNVLASHATPIDTMLAQTLERSDNRVAEILFKSAGAALTKARGSFVAGGAAVRAVLDRSRAALPEAASIAQVGDDVTVRDGSGLSRNNRLAALDFTRALRWAYRRPWSSMFIQHLPHGAQPRSTLRKRFRGSPVARYLRAKTGYLYHVRALSGYLRVGDQRVLVFSVLMNGLSTTSPSAKKALDRFITDLWRAERR